MLRTTSWLFQFKNRPDESYNAIRPGIAHEYARFVRANSLRMTLGCSEFENKESFIFNAGGPDLLRAY